MPGRFFRVPERIDWSRMKSQHSMEQTWHDLLFAHWPVKAAQLADVVPRELPLDRYDGECWLGVVPFRMSGVRFRWMPALPWLSAFPELNVRTYVTLGGEPGVFFLSLDATRLAAVLGARLTFGLPYFWADMALERSGSRVRYRSRRRLASGSAVFEARYEPVGVPRQAAAGTLEHFLTERYCLYTCDASGGVRRCRILHTPWSLRDAAAEIEVNTMARAAGVSLPSIAPLLHHAELQRTLVWPLSRV